MLIRLLLDYVCWIVTTFVLVMYQYPTIAAFVGATGIVYLFHATTAYLQIRKVIREEIQRIIDPDSED